jgi:hypothetical protein
MQKPLLPFVFPPFSLFPFYSFTSHRCCLRRGGGNPSFKDRQQRRDIWLSIPCELDQTRDNQTEAAGDESRVRAAIDPRTCRKRRNSYIRHRPTLQFFHFLFIPFYSSSFHRIGRVQAEPVVVAADCDDRDEQERACPVRLHVSKCITQTHEPRYACRRIAYPLVESKCAGRLFRLACRF